MKELDHRARRDGEGRRVAHRGLRPHGAVQGDKEPLHFRRRLLERARHEEGARAAPEDLLRHAPEHPLGQPARAVRRERHEIDLPVVRRLDDRHGRLAVRDHRLGLDLFLRQPRLDRL